MREHFEQSIKNMPSSLHISILSFALKTMNYAPELEQCACCKAGEQ